MRKPRPMVPGSIVRLAATSGPVPADRFAVGVQVLEGWGLVPRWEPRLFDRHGYLAGSDEARANELVEAFTSEGVDGVIAARGGYGAMRLLDSLVGRGASLPARLFLGFSDLTALHLHFMGVGDLVTFHGANVTTLSQLDQESKDRTRNALMGLHRQTNFSWDGLRPVASGRAAGRMVAANLSLLGAMMGTRFAPKLAGSILLLEDVGEPVYRLDRLLTQIALAVEAAGIAGVVIGDLGVPAAENAQLEAVLQLFARAIGRPVVTGFPAGHGTRLHPVPEGVRAELDADQGILRVIEDPYEDSNA